MRKPVFKFILFCLTLSGFLCPDFASCTTPTHTSSEPSSLISGDGYQLAKTWFLPDWQSDTRSYNTDGGNNDNGGGDPWTDNEPADGRCSIYGFKETAAVDTYLYDCDVKHPITGMTCYDNCVCKPKFQYTSSNCTAASGKVVSGRSCGGKYESCVCKPTVSVGTGEKCDISCNGNCVQKSCKSSVSVGTGEECSERCASNTGICTAKRCKASVSYNSSTGEYCAEKCASNAGVCTKKGCNKICKDEYTGSIPSNGYATTKTCSDCSGSYTVKTGWACNSGYHASGSSCIADHTHSYSCPSGYQASGCSSSQAQEGTTSKVCSCGQTSGTCYKCRAKTCTEQGKKDCNGSCIATSECCGGCSSGYTCSNGTCVNNDCNATAVSVPTNGYCSNKNSCGICTAWACNPGYEKSGSTCYKPSSGGTTTKKCTTTGGYNGYSCSEWSGYTAPGQCQQKYEQMGASCGSNHSGTCDVDSWHRCCLQCNGFAS